MRNYLSSLIVCLAGVGVALAQTPPTSAKLVFTDATAASGIRYRNVCGAKLGEKGWLAEGMGSGAAWLDYDGDGNLDLYIVNGSGYDRAADQGEPNQLFRGDGKGKFTETTDRAGVGHRGWGYGVTVGDYDNDGDPDLYVTNFGPNVLYRNEGDGTFVDVTGKAGVGHEAFSSSAAFFDMDRDGDLDLYVGNYMVSDPKLVPRRGSEAARKANCQFQGIDVACGPLGQVPLADVLYRNNGDGTFADVSAASGIQLETPRYTLGVVSGDYDNDGDTDLYVANDSVQNSLWKNRGDGTFIDAGVMTLSALNADGRAQAGMLDDRVLEWVPEIADLNEELGYKDREITFAHLLEQTSGYGLTERPGDAFAYNDYATGLLTLIVLNRISGLAPDQVDELLNGPGMERATGLSIGRHCCIPTPSPGESAFLCGTYGAVRTAVFARQPMGKSGGPPRRPC